MSSWPDSVLRGSPSHFTFYLTCVAYLQVIQQQRVPRGIANLNRRDGVVGAQPGSLKISNYSRDASCIHYIKHTRPTGLCAGIPLGNACTRRRVEPTDGRTDGRTRAPPVCVDTPIESSRIAGKEVYRPRKHAFVCSPFSGNCETGKSNNIMCARVWCTV